MPRNNRRQIFSLLLLLLLCLPGCSREVRYSVLTFFFTGVPPLDAPPEPTVAVRPVLSKREQMLAERDRLAATRPFTGPYQHGPYAANNCEQCHVMAETGGFGFGKSSSDGKKSIVPGRFVLPPLELCVDCHTGKSAAAAQRAGLALHGPAWNCTLCHDPHKSKELSLLRISADQLCRQCHGEGYIHDAELHAGADDCLACHNPHMGREASMLRDDLREAF